MYAASSGAVAAGSSIVALVLIMSALGAYFVPSIVAWVRHVPNAGSVTVLNVLLGWTLVGWAVSLAMACRSQPHAVVVNVGQQYPPLPPL
jgi:hypothetical protein